MHKNYKLKITLSHTVQSQLLYSLTLIFSSLLYFLLSFPLNLHFESHPEEGVTPALQNGSANRQFTRHLQTTWRGRRKAQRKRIIMAVRNEPQCGPSRLHGSVLGEALTILAPLSALSTAAASKVTHCLIMSQRGEEMKETKREAPKRIIRVCY